MFPLATFLTPLFLVLAEPGLDSFEALSGMKQQLIEMQLKASEQEKELEDLRLSMSSFKSSGPSDGVLGLFEVDGSLGEISSRSHDEKFTHVTTVSVRVPVIDNQNLPKKKRPSFKTKVRPNSEQVVVTINTRQEVKLWDAEQNEIATLSLGSGARVKALVAQFPKGDERSFLLIGFSDGNVFQYPISVWRVWNKKSFRLSLYGSIMRLAHPVLAVPPVEPSKGEENDEDERKVPAVTALGLHLQKKHSKVIVGYKDGWSRSFRLSGKMKKELQVGNDSIVMVGSGRSLNSMPIFTESGFRFHQVSGLKPQGDFCPYKEGARFIDYALDETSKSILYVGYSDGTISAYGTKKLKDVSLCSPIHELTVESGVPLHLETTDGYLLASSPTSLYIFNTSEISTKNPPNLLEKRVMTDSFSGLSPIVLSSTKDWYQHNLIVAAQVFTVASDSESTAEACKDETEGGSTMAIFESSTRTRKKSKLEGLSITDAFSRSTAVMIAAICVFVWQFFLKTNSPFSKMMGGGKDDRKRKNAREPARFGGGSAEQDMLDMQRMEMMRLHKGHNIDSDSSR